MKNGLFKIDWVNIKSAIVHGILGMILGAALSIATYIYQAGSVFGLDWHIVVDKGAISALGIFVSICSVLNNLLTTDRGNFLGSIKVVKDISYH